MVSCPKYFRFEYSWSSKPGFQFCKSCKFRHSYDLYRIRVAYCLNFEPCPILTDLGLTSWPYNHQWSSGSRKHPFLTYPKFGVQETTARVVCKRNEEAIWRRRRMRGKQKRKMKSRIYIELWSGQPTGQRRAMYEAVIAEVEWRSAGDCE